MKNPKIPKYKVELIKFSPDMIQARAIVSANYDEQTARMFWRELTAYAYDYFPNRFKYPSAFYMIKEGDKVVCIGAYYTSMTIESNFELCWINTDKDYRNKGYATAMVKHIEREILIHNYSHGNIILTSKKENVKFYQNLGYEVISENVEFLMCKKY